MYLFISKYDGSAIERLCLSGWRVAIALKMELAHALSFGGGGYRWVFFFFIFLLGGRDAFGDSNGGGESCKSEQTDHHGRYAFENYLSECPRSLPGKVN